jgi:hypothetical protein
MACGGAAEVVLEAMSTAQRRWSRLAEELGLSFKPGVRGMLESKLAERILVQQGRDPGQLEALMNNGLLMAVLDQVFLGAAIGTYRDYELYVYRNNRTSSSSSSAAYSVHVQLFLPKAAELGLSIDREQFWSRVGKLFGAQDIQSGNVELDAMVMIKAKDERRARRMVEEPELQQALLDLFRHSDGFALDDDGIEHRTHGPEFLEAPVVRDVADRMVEAAGAIRRVLRL